MNSVLEIMLERYNPRNNEERENAIKEIMQEIVLSGLSHGGFFEKAAFYDCTLILHHKAIYCKGDLMNFGCKIQGHMLL